MAAFASSAPWSDDAAMRGRLRRWGVGLAGWALAGVFFATQNQVAYLQYDSPPPFRTTLVRALCHWMAWAPFAPFILWLARRYPFARGRIGRALAVHAAGAAAVVTGKLWLDAAARALILGDQLRFWPGDGHLALVTYALLVAAMHVSELRGRMRERELRASQLESRLAQARLQVLELQLQPHFLFNTLHAISALVHHDAARADRMISQLADLLRLSLQGEGRQEVPLRQELEFVERYLEIERTRFADRLTVEYQVDRAVLGARVPGLLLQPLVENAVRHGIGPRPAPGRIQLRAARDDGELRVEIADDGVGLRGPPREGVGIGNARARLLELYGPGERLAIAGRPEGGVIVTLRVPYVEDA
jgi:two-component system LytT family sensor kinase